MGLEGLVSKHRERVYRGGRCDHWIKVKNRDTRPTAASRTSSEIGKSQARDVGSTYVRKRGIYDRRVMLVSETSLLHG